MKFKSRQGFTLTEVMVTLTISAFLLASVYATVMSLAKGSESMINYSEMNRQARIALELFGRDIRMASWVDSASKYKIRIEREIRNTTYDVEFEYNPQAGTLSRFVYDHDTNSIADIPNADRILIYDIDDLAFSYFTQQQNTPMTITDIKHVQLEALMERKVLNIINTNEIISARFMMRNKRDAMGN
ncbi:MAG: PilW family protein [Oceanipulchritudo sp.]